MDNLLRHCTDQRRLELHGHWVNNHFPGIFTGGGVLPLSELAEVDRGHAQVVEATTLPGPVRCLRPIGRGGLAVDPQPQAAEVVGGGVRAGRGRPRRSSRTTARTAAEASTSPT